MTDHTKEILNDIGVLLVIILGVLLIEFSAKADSPGRIEIYIIDQAKNLVYHAETLDDKIQLHVDKETGYAYVLSLEKDKPAKEICRVEISNAYIIVKRSKTVEII